MEFWELRCAKPNPPSRPTKIYLFFMIDNSTNFPWRAITWQRLLLFIVMAFKMDDKLEAIG